MTADNNQDDKWKKFSDEQAQEPELEAETSEQLDGELNEAEQKIAQYKEQALRAQAELQNVRRRAERDVQNAYKFGSEKLIGDILPVVESIERGLASGAQDDPMRAGLQLTLDQFEKALAKHGVELIVPKAGDAFNPEQHEAMAMQPDPKAKPNTILHVAQRGYMLNGRVLKAAMVVVAA